MLQVSKNILLLNGRERIGLASGWIWGFNQGEFQHALMEKKLAVANMPKADPQLREYLKARIYSNVLVFHPNDPGYLLPKDWDHGPVDKSVLGETYPFKGPDSVAWNWKEAMEGK